MDTSPRQRVATKRLHTLALPAPNSDDASARRATERHLALGDDDCEQLDFYKHLRSVSAAG